MYAIREVNSFADLLHKPQNTSRADNKADGRLWVRCQGHPKVFALERKSLKGH